MRLWRRRSDGIVDPIGWDPRARRVHDVGHLPSGQLLHYSTCWCRRTEAEQHAAEAANAVALSKIPRP